jgi:hypothetical protein
MFKVQYANGMYSELYWRDWEDFNEFTSISKALEAVENRLNNIWDTQDKLQFIGYDSDMIGMYKMKNSDFRFRFMQSPWHIGLNDV